VQYFQKELPPKAESDVEGLMQMAYGIKLNPKRMKKLEKDYQIQKAKEQEETVELRVNPQHFTLYLYFSTKHNLQRLRTDNRCLRQKVELLEAESAELADRLVRGQVSRAEEEEESFVLQRELAALRHAHLETQHRLEMAQEQVIHTHMLLEETVSKLSFTLKESFLILFCSLLQSRMLAKSPRQLRKVYPRKRSWFLVSNRNSLKLGFVKQKTRRLFVT